MNQEPTFSLREASQQLSIKPSTLRYSCNQGLIPRIRRNKRGCRILTQPQIDLAFILLNMKQAGFTTAEIRQYSRLYRRGHATITERTALLTTRKRQLWQEITERQKAIDFIERQEELSQSQPTEDAG